MEPYRLNPRGILIDPAVEVVPNFPLLVTDDLLRSAKPTKTEHLSLVEFPPHWYVYAFRAPDMTYWRVDVVTKTDWYLAFDVGEGEDRGSWNIWTHGSRLERPRTMEFRSWWEGHPNPVRDYFGRKANDEYYAWLERNTGARWRRSR